MRLRGLRGVREDRRAVAANWAPTWFRQAAEAAETRDCAGAENFLGLGSKAADDLQAAVRKLRASGGMTSQATGYTVDLDPESLIRATTRQVRLTREAAEAAYAHFCGRGRSERGVGSGAAAAEEFLLEEF